jgi:hypothetical protein
MISYITIGILGAIVILQGWWIFRSIKLLWVIKDLFSSVYANIATYYDHLKHVHSLERYYGDETLKGLIEHGESTCLGVEEFLEIFAEFEDSGEINLPEFEEEEEEEIIDEESRKEAESN